MSRDGLFTIEELRQVNPEAAKRASPWALPLPRKPRIARFEEFDSGTALVYRAIRHVLEEANPNQEDLRVWAIGSRITGKWRTPEETAQLLKDGYRTKPSDYDIGTNADSVPSRQQFLDRLALPHVFVDVFRRQAEALVNAVEIPAEQTPMTIPESGGP